MPATKGGTVRYNQRNFHLSDRENKLLHIVANPKNKETAPLYVNADVNLYVSEITAPDTLVEFQLKPGRQAYINCIEGTMKIAGYPSLNQQDSLTISEEGCLKLSAADKYAHFIIIEMAQS